MFRLTALASALATLAMPAHAGGHSGITGYALSADGSSLMVMESVAEPTQVRTVELSSPVRSIAWRPVTGDLVGYADDAIVTIDTATGETMDEGANFMQDAQIDEAAVVAFDFNNKIDAARAVSSMGDNLVYFPSDFGDEKASSVRRFTDLFYAEGDISENADPLIFANAYTNAIAGAKANTTFQYALDAHTNALVSLANNAGQLETIAPVTIDDEPADILPVGGFDIVSPEEGSDTAFAVLQINGQDSAELYTIDLMSGAATLLSELGTTDISSFAVSSGM